MAVQKIHRPMWQRLVLALVMAVAAMAGALAVAFVFHLSSTALVASFVVAVVLAVYFFRQF